MMKSISLRLSSFAFLATMAIGTATNAGTLITVNTTIGGNAVDATADVTLDATNHTITVALTNLLVDPKTVAQNVSGFQIGFSNSVTVTGESTSQFQTVVIDGAGIPTFATVAAVSPVTGGTAATAWPGWVLDATSGSSLKLNDLAGFDALFPTLNHNGPAYTLVGGHSGLDYSANGSIDGNGPHNPFIYETVTWTFNVTGLTDATSVTGGSLQFGTTAGFTAGTTTDGGGPGPGGTGSPLPEPGALAVWGFLGLAGMIYRRRRAA